MTLSQGVKVEYDVATKRVAVSYGDRRVMMAGTYASLDEANKAADRYANRYLIKK